MNRPKLIGITGGIGSGKTTVCKILESLGLQVYYADDRAKELMITSDDIKSAIIHLYGNEAYSSDGLDRAFIAKKAFDNPSLLEKLNEIVHPAVKEDFERWVQSHANEKVLVKEAALLIETGSFKELDALIVVTADEETRISRILKRDAHRTHDDVQKIINSQLSDTEREEHANYIIRNDGKDSLIKQAVEIHKQLVVA